MSRTFWGEQSSEEAITVHFRQVLDGHGDVQESRGCH